MTSFKTGCSFTNGQSFFESACHGETERHEYWPATEEARRFIPKHAFPHDLPPAESVHATAPALPKTPLKVQDELFAMPEWKRVARVNHLGMSIRLFERNAKRLLSALDQLTRDPRTVRLAYLSHHAELDVVLEEVVHLVHDFVAGALTLVDHTRVLYRELYEADRSFPDYQREVEEQFIGSPLIQFVKCLRQLAQHVRLPNISFVLSTQANGETVRKIMLPKDDLLRASSSAWNARATQYLATAPAKIDLEEVVRSYRDAVRRFYTWMQGRQREIHAPDVEAIIRKQREGISLMAPLVPTKLESGLAIFDQGVGDIAAIFGSLLGPEDWAALARNSGDQSAQVDTALAIVEKRFGALPRDLVQRIRAASRQDRTRGHGRSTSP